MKLIRFESVNIMGCTGILRMHCLKNFHKFDMKVSAKSFKMLYSKKNRRERKKTGGYYAIFYRTGKKRETCGFYRIV